MINWKLVFNIPSVDGGSTTEWKSRPCEDRREKRR